MLCPGLTDVDALRSLGHRIAQAVSFVEIGGYGATIDFGVEVVERRPFRFDVADAALYEAKRRRARITCK